MEFKQTDPFDYKASATRVDILDLSPRLFASIKGEGDPNGPAFEKALGALYTYSYAVRMCGKGDHPPTGWFPYVVGVLQGRWTLRDGATGFDPSNKADLSWTILIRQPNFLDTHLHSGMLETSLKKARTKDPELLPWLERLQLGLREGGRFAQILHQGPYDDEPATFARMEQELSSMRLGRADHDHTEIYLSDPRKTAPEKMRTILRAALRT